MAVNNAPVAEHRLLTAPELAAYLCVPIPWCWSAARSGRIPAIRAGRYVRFDLQAVIAALSGQSPEGDPDDDE